MLPRLIRVLRPAGILAAVLLLSSCEVLGLTIGGNGRRAELDQQRARWARQHITSYRMTYRRDCFCGTEFTTPTEIEVRGGAIATANYAESDEPIPGYVQSNLPTVESLFAIVDAAIDQEVDLLDVTYHPSLGYPTKIAIDYRFNIADDEQTHSVLTLGIILPPINP